MLKFLQTVKNELDDVSVLVNEVVTKKNTDYEKLSKDYDDLKKEHIELIKGVESPIENADEPKVLSSREIYNKWKEGKL